VVERRELIAEGALHALLDHFRGEETWSPSTAGLANPEEPYSHACNVAANVPRRQLVFAAGNLDLWVVVYQHGRGLIGPQLMLATVERRNDVWVVSHQGHVYDWDFYGALWDSGELKDHLLGTSGRAIPGASHPLAIVLDGDFREIGTVKDIPDNVLSELLDKFSDERGLADVGEPFQNVKQAEASVLPMRRFIVAGHSDAIWLIAYEHGEPKYHHHLVFLAVAGEGIRVEWEGEGTIWAPPFLTKRAPASLKDVKRAIVAGQFGRAAEGCGEW
jgi:hypothetical protein